LILESLHDETVGHHGQHTQICYGCTSRRRCLQRLHGVPAAILQTFRDKYNQNISHLFESPGQEGGSLIYYKSHLIRQEETADLKVVETLRAKGCLDKNDTEWLDEVVKKLEETKMKTNQHLIKRGMNGPNRKQC
jgi:hypothetical protein